MLAGVQRDAVLEDGSMFEEIDVQAQARGFHEVGWRLQEMRCLEGTRARGSFLVCTKQANKRFAATRCDRHISLAGSWAWLGTSLAIQR